MIMHTVFWSVKTCISSVEYFLGNFFFLGGGGRGALCREDPSSCSQEMTVPCEWTLHTLGMFHVHPVTVYCLPCDCSLYNLRCHTACIILSHVLRSHTVCVLSTHCLCSFNTLFMFFQHTVCVLSTHCLCSFKHTVCVVSTHCLCSFKHTVCVLSTHCVLSNTLFVLFQHTVCVLSTHCLCSFNTLFVFFQTHCVLSTHCLCPFKHTNC